MLIDKYKDEISSFLMCNKSNIFLYWKGRVALYAFLKSLNLREGDEVIVPAFTCVAVPNAIIYAGLKPVYVDISPKTFNINILLLEKVITDRSKVVICQNTFGLSSDIEDLIITAKKYNLYTIEDCTHGFGGYYNGKPNGSYCDAAFYSTQWNKPFSTGIGGILVINNNELLQKFKSVDDKKIKPGFGEKIILKNLLLFRKYFINKFTQWFLVKLYRFLSVNNLIIGSNQSAELNSIIKPKNYLKSISNVQIRAGLKSLKKLPDLNMLRKKNAKDYTMFLKHNNKNYVEESFFENHLFLRYPILVTDRQKFFELAKRKKISIGNWFLSPLHPVIDDLSTWFLNRSSYPIADTISTQIVNLPTDVLLNRDVIEFLDSNLDLIV